MFDLLFGNKAVLVPAIIVIAVLIICILGYIKAPTDAISSSVLLAGRLPH